MLQARAAVVLIGLVASAAAAAPPPNILLIMAVDLGKEWVACCGARDMRTPHIDAMAKKYLGVDSYPYRTPTEKRVIYHISVDRCSAMG